MTENEIAKQVFESALCIHRSLGPGLLDSVYQECLYFELQKKGLHIEKEKPLPLIYKEVKLDIGYRVGLLIEQKFIVEIKSVEALNDIHKSQILTYLNLANCKIGMLINFNVILIKLGVKRIINSHYVKE